MYVYVGWINSTYIYLGGRRHWNLIHNSRKSFINKFFDSLAEKFYSSSFYSPFSYPLKSLKIIAGEKYSKVYIRFMEMGEREGVREVQREVRER